MKARAAVIAFFALLALVGTTFAAVISLSPGDAFSCPTQIVNVNNAASPATGACATPTPSPTPTLTPTPVPTATLTPVPLVWMRPSMTMLAESVGYNDGTPSVNGVPGTGSCKDNVFGCGTEPLYVWQGLSPATCASVAHGDDDDHVYVVGQFSAPTTIYGVRISSWGGSNADVLTIDFRATSDTTPDTDAPPAWVPPVSPFVTLSGSLTSGAMTRLTGMVNPPVTTQYVRFEATNSADWVTGSDLEFLVNAGTPGQPAC